MFYFNPKETEIFQAIQWESHWIFKNARIIRRSSFYFFIIVFPIFFFSLVAERLSDRILSMMLGFLIISLDLWIFFWLQESFFNSRLKNPKLHPADITLQAKVLEGALPAPKENNLADFLSFEVARAALKCVNFAKARGIPIINSTHLFYFLLADNPKLNFIFSRAILDLPEIKETLKKKLKGESSSGEKKDPEYSADFQEIIISSFKTAVKKEHSRVELGDVIIALAEDHPYFKKILIASKLKPKDIENLNWWIESFEKKINRDRRFWDYENLMRRGSLAKDWASGYTITLDQYAIDWTEIVKRRGFEEIVGHKKEIEAVERVLSGTGINNCLMVGEPGVGKKSIVHALSMKVFYGQSLPELNYKRVVELDLTSLLSRIVSPEEVEEVLDRIFKEILESGNIILVIDEFHNYVSQIPRPGVVDISGVIASYLNISSFRTLAITSFAGLHKYVEQNPSLLSFFEKVEIPALLEEETILILENLIPGLEKKYKKFVTYPALRDIVSHSSRYIQAVPFPKKAIDLLDDVLVYSTRYVKGKFILPEHVAKIVSEKTQIPVGEVEAKEKITLLNLEKLFHERIINQEEAVSEVSEALRRARTDITVRKGPMGCFLFLGPTGVGKTETSKALAEIYFGSESRMIRLDMSEFQSTEDIPRLLGSAGQEGLLTTPVIENPFSLILLDELEKAHPNILNLFLQVLDEGHVTDGLGRKISFANTIIIATSNAGYEIILEAITSKREWGSVKKYLLDYLFSKAIFRPEFINRFDAVVVFKPLTPENLFDIAELLLSKLKQNLAKKEIEFVITKPLKTKIVELSYNPIFGAREMRRVIQDKVEDALAQAILRDEIKAGSKIEIDPEGFKIVVKR